MTSVATPSWPELLRPLGAYPSELSAGSPGPITGIGADSRAVKPGDLFVCMPSLSRDTHAFLPAVQAAGISAAVVHSRSGLEQARQLGLPAVLIEGSEARFNGAVGRLARAVTGDPTARLQVVGVTGTNGKTTTTWLLRQALNALGVRTAYLGTLGYQGGSELEELGNTTPFPVELWNLLARAEREGMAAVAMETSSHALHGRRLAGVQFDVGAFTHLTQDHLDYHGTMENYAAAKKLLFTEYAMASEKPMVGCLNLADGYAQSWRSELPCRVLTYAAQPGMAADLMVEAREVRFDRLKLHVRHGVHLGEADVPVGGAFNVENVATALATLLALGYELPEVLPAMAHLSGVPGRFEAVPNGTGIGVIVDYAHTPDALAQLLKAAAMTQPRRIITVFGCGGDRDRTKRPLMAAAASSASDLTIITSDNPRTEDPRQILQDVEAGIVTGRPFATMEDREAAVAHAIGQAEPGDLVVIAGKGHETYQIIGTTRHPMDDRELARAALARRGGSA